MPEFHLNMRHVLPSGRVSHYAPHPFYQLGGFARGYVEAMFFTNGDTGDERENLLNDWGVERLTREAVADIKTDCDKFQAEMIHTGIMEAFADGAYSEEQAGRDFWFTRQGHGAGFGDRFDELSESTRDSLTDLARGFGEATVEAYRGWIYHR